MKRYNIRAYYAGSPNPKAELSINKAKSGKWIKYEDLNCKDCEVCTHSYVSAISYEYEQEIAKLKDSIIVWHDPKEKPAGGTTLLLEYENGDFETWNHYNSPALWDDFCRRHVLARWAYIKPPKE